uniref:DUF2569 domain-containing protein n=1 Tax=Desulfacinum infernum TaxID=35837 RepID=A0A832A0I0_9BACT
MAQQTTEAITVPTSSDVKEEVKGIGGWLILPALGMIYNCILGLFQLVMGFIALMAAAENGDIEGPVFLYTVLTLCVGYVFYTTWLFFKKSRKAPKAIVILFLVSAGLSFIEVAFTNEVAPALAALIPVAIWVPYFQTSKRVKNTFVN